MSDDLVKRLRKNVMCGDAVIEEAADRIERLEDELHHCFHRINELQAALREIRQSTTLYGAQTKARNALEGKDD